MLVHQLFVRVTFWLSAVSAAPQSPANPRIQDGLPSDNHPSTRTWSQALNGWVESAIQHVPFLHEEPVPERASPLSDRNIEKYIGQVVLRFEINSPESEKALAEAITALYIDVWSKTKDYVDLRMSKETLPDFLSYLPSSVEVSYTQIVDSLFESVMLSYPKDQESIEPLLRTVAKANSADIFSRNSLFFEDYRPMSVIVPWMKLLQSMYPDLAQLIHMGDSFEGRPIYALKVGKHQEGRRKKTVIITGAAHAREWISVSTVNYLIHSLVTGYGRGNIAIDDMVEGFEWVFVPTLNVDGYVYSWETDRLWRKNRQPTSVSFCKGIDLDRAYSFHFDDSARSSGNPCSDIFPGKQPFEATESRVFSDWFEKYKNRRGNSVIALLDLHSYSQQILYPYSYSCDDQPPNLENLEELGIGLAKAIRTQSGEHYEVTSACEGTAFASYPAMSGSGSLLDFAYAVHNVPYTYQVKLRDTGNYGFLLPKSSIVPTGREMFSLITYLAQFLTDDGSPKSVKPKENGEVVELEL